MSIDLEWLKLDSSLSTNLITLLNRQLDTADRPSFIGPIKVTSLDFGSNSPDIELVDLRDIYRDFLEDDEDELERERGGGGTFGGAVKVTEGGMGMGMDEDDGFEWVSRRAGVRRSNSTGAGNLHQQHSSQYLSPPGGSSTGGGGSGDYFAATAIPTSTDTWNAGLGRPPSFADYGHGHGSSSPYRNAVEVPVYRSPSPSTPFAPPSPIQRRSSEELGFGNTHSFTAGKSHPYASRHSQPQPPPQQEPPQPPPPNPHPNLQLHLHVNWHSNLRISLQTSLLINYPSPMFMSLPIRLSVTGLVFNGELAVAYEGERKRVHLCILDDLDPYGPAGARKLSNNTNITNANTPNSNSSSNTNLNNSPLNPNPSSTLGGSGGVQGVGVGTTPPELNDSILMGTAGLGLGGFNSSLGVGNPTLPSYIPPPPQSSIPSTSILTTTSTIPSINPTSTSTGSNTNNNNDPFGYNPTTYSRPIKPLLPIGQRLLPSIFIESEIGQADKHVLKNVTRVERFIQDVIRKTVEEELVFPNFHTLVMDPDA